MSSNSLIKEPVLIKSLKGFDGNSEGWGLKKGEFLMPMEDVLMIQIQDAILVLKKESKDRQKEIISQFLSSGHATGSNLKMGIPVYRFDENNEKQSFTKMGLAESVVKSGGGNDI